MKCELVLFDGDCGICNKSAEFIKKKNPDIDVKPSQIVNLKEINSILTQEIVLQSVVFVDKDSVMYLKSKAIFEIMKRMGGLYKIMGFVLSNTLIVFLSNPIYNVIAKNRAKISKFLGLNACKI